MSAYVVTQKHISAILRFHNQAPDYRSPASIAYAQQLGEQLYLQNIASVNYRYRYRNEPAGEYPPFKFSPNAPLLAPVEVLRLLECLEYQSNETPEYYATPGYEVLARLRAQAIAQLPGFKEARREI